jgi:hypothetical protein
MTKTKIEIRDLNAPPRRLYQRDRQVSFIGGEGIVRSFTFEDGSWEYLVEMPQGIKPTFGRAGAETMVLLNERELRAA